jgi:PST family polysaccharide transporter
MRSLRPFGEDGTFPPAENAKDLRLTAVRGAGATVLSSGLGLVVQIASTVILARLLTPGDFGVVTMVTTFSLLLVNFGLNGFTEAILQRETLDRYVVSNLFWINLGAGLFLTLGFAGAGSLLAHFYGDARVANVAVGMSATILITSLAVQHLALLKRAMRFSVLSANDVLSKAMAVGISVVLAWAGWGYWALVAGMIAQALTTALGAWILCRWMPSLPRRVKGTADMVRYAMHVYGRFSVNYFARNMDNLLVGWRFNAQALGFYKKAYDLFALSGSQLVAPLTSVAVSALSRLQRDSAQYRRYLLNALAVMAFVGMGIGADLTLTGRDIIRILLGPGWETSGKIFVYFGPGIGMMLLYGTHSWIHLSIGRADRWFRWGMIELAVTVLLFLLGLHWGPAGIAVAWTASFWILSLPAFWYAGQPIGLGIGPVVRAVWKFLIASLFAGCAAAALLSRLPGLMVFPGPRGSALRIVVASGALLVLYLGTVILLYGGLAPIRQVTGLLRDMLPRSKRSELTPAIGATCEELSEIPAG